MRAKVNGFTLVELLVVIAIIGILAAILFPVFVSAKAAASMASCQSNIKQLGTAIQMYSDSNDGRLPNYSIGNGAARRLWWEFVNPYLKAGKIYRCPALPDSQAKEDIRDYGANARVYGYGAPYPHLWDPAKKPPKMATVPRQSKIMLLGESYCMTDIRVNAADPPRLVECGYPVVYCRCTQCAAHSYQDELPDGNVGGRHGGRSDSRPYGKTVVLYCDIHVKVWPKEYVTQPYDSLAESKNGDLWAHYDSIER